MGLISADTRLAGNSLPAYARDFAGSATCRALVALAAFGLYWLSAAILQARGGTLHFGADSHHYAPLANGTFVDRAARFHPVTIAMAVVWMKLLGPLTPWLAPQMLLKGMFAAVGAAGVWAAMAVFAAVSPRRHVPLLGVVYATSLGIWYFSSIEESKIVTTTLAACYLATYLRLRTRWSTGGAALLTGILLLACLNEIVAAFLVAVPTVDALVQHGRDLRGNLRRNWWIACHALAAPMALLLLEGVVNGRLVAAGTEPEGASHVSMLYYYFLQSDLSAATIYAFVVRWLFFNIAAPSIDASFGADPRWHYMGDFKPALAGYLDSPVSIGLVALLVAILVVSLLPPYRGRLTRNAAGIMLGLAAYALLRGLFFLVLEPGECLLFSSGVTLPHLMLIAMPLAVSSFPWKQSLLAGFAALLLIVNAAFIIGQ